MKEKTSETIYIGENVVQIKYSDCGSDSLKLSKAFIQINNEKPFYLEFDSMSEIEFFFNGFRMCFELFGVSAINKILDQVANDVRSLQIDLQTYQKKYTPILPMTKQEEANEAGKRG